MEQEKRPFYARAADAAFLVNWLKNPLAMGAVSPSSRALGRRMAAMVPAGPPDGVVVELGPGTGVVTACLIEAGTEPERLACLEYAPEFCTLLRARFPAIHVLQGDAYDPPAALRDWIGARPIRAVVSSLPLMTKPEGERVRALRRWLDLLPAGAPFIQFSYAFAPPVRGERVGAEATLSPWIKRNLPPARVITYRREVDHGAARSGLSLAARVPK